MRLRHFLPPHHVVECPLCGAHVKVVHIKKFFNIFFLFSGLRSIFRSNTGRMVAPKICTGSKLEIHLLWLTDTVLLRCQRCDRFFLTRSALSSHLAEHEEYKCKECHQTFPAHLSLAAHLYNVHKKVFNLGKKFKSGRNQWDVGGFANASTFTVANNEDVEVNDDDEEIRSDQSLFLNKILHWHNLNQSFIFI